MAWMVGSNRHRCRYQLWSVIHRDGDPERSAGGGFSTIRSQNSRALGRVAYVNSVHGCGSPRRPRAEREVPVQEKQRGEALLPVERLERPVVHLAVDEVEADRPAACQGLVQSLEEGAADVVDARIVASLGVVPLDQRDLDARDLAVIVAALPEHASERCRVTLHACDSSRSSGSSGESFSGRSSSRYGPSASSIASR